MRFKSLILIIIVLPLIAQPIDRICDLYKSQKHEDAFREFLKELESKTPKSICEDESESYREALAIYLSPNALPNESAREIIENYPNATDPNITYLLAVSHANEGNFDQFFKLFWNAYTVNPNHFLVPKAKAVLHIKLLEKAPTPEKREIEKRAIVNYAAQALMLEPRDHSLYRFILSFCEESERKELLKTNLSKIIHNNIITPRTDIKFYVHQAVDCHEYELAQCYIDRAKEWYQFSRAIQAAQDYLDRKKAL